MTRNRRAVLLFAVASATLAALLAGVAQAGPRAVSLAHPLPSLVRQKALLTIRGRITGAPRHTRVALELERLGGHWTVASASGPAHGGAFTLRWRVPKNDRVGPVSMRVAGIARSGAVVAKTASIQSAIGPAAVYCAPATPPAVEIPEGSGWVVGGVYTQGGPYPGVYECDSQQYTITATGSNGKVAASQTFPGGHSYTLVLPAGSYTLSVGECRGTATVTAATQTTANTYCDVP